MKKIVYKTDNGIAVITPTKEGLAIFGIEGVAEKDVLDGAEYKIIEDTELPKDRVFRNAWNYDLKEDIPKSKEIWKDKLRADRKPLLAALDVDSMRAIEDAKDTVAIIAEKNRLRDITLLVDAAKTIDEIKAITLTV